MGKDTSTPTLFEGEGFEQGKETLQKETLHKDDSIEKQAKDWEVIGSKTKTRSKKSNGRKKAISAKQAELTMTVVPPLLVEAELMHQAKQQELHETSDLPETSTVVPETSAVAPIMEEAALHQRAKVLGLPDKLPAPTAHLDLPQGEQVLVPETALPILQEGAVHQRAKALGLPDAHAHENLPPKESMVDSKHEFDEKQLQDGQRQAIIEDTLASVPPVVTMHVAEGNSFGEKFMTKLRVRRNSLEEVGHNARLKVDAALERKFGSQAEKIQTELERARLTVISDTARMADILHEHFGHCASDLKTQQVEAKIPHVELAEEKELPVALLQGDNIVAQKSLELQRSLAANGHIAREKMDAVVESKIGPKVAPVMMAIERVKDMAMEDAVGTAEQLHVQLGTAASSLREQVLHGATPNYH